MLKFSSIFCLSVLLVISLVTRAFAQTSNVPPSFDPIADQTVSYSTSSQSIAITNISAGTEAESDQMISMSATSSDPTLVPNPTISVSGATKTLSYTTATNTDGTAVITVTADDGQSENNTFSRTFSINVSSTLTDTTAPSGTILINNGAAYTNSRTVTLTLSATDDLSGVAQMKFSNGGAYSSPEPYATTKSWLLSSSGDGLKTVRVKFMDEAGNETATGTPATITLDTASPALGEITPVSTPSTSTTTNYTFSSTEDGTITYGGDCSSNTSSAATGNNTVTFNTLARTTHSNCTISVTDSAGNTSNPLAITIFTINKLDATLTLSNLAQTYDGTNKSATITTNPAGLSGVTVTYDSSTTQPKNVGNYSVVATLSNANYTAPQATGTLVISAPNAIATDAGNLSNILTSYFVVPDTASANNTSMATTLSQVTLNIDTNGSNVVLPASTIITRTDGASFDISSLSATSVSASSLSNLGNNTVVDGAIQWGIPNTGLTFNQAITLNIYVGTSLNGQTLNVVRSTSTSSGWTSDGIVAPATCTVTGGICTFQATKASYYATERTVTPASTVTSTSNSGGGSTTPAGAPICTDAKPSTAPMLLFATSALPNSVNLTWLLTAGPATYYLVAYGMQQGSPQYGNPDVGITTSYTVNGLSAGTYYFRVRAGNGCAPGDYSNEVAVTIGGQQLTTPAQGFAAGVLGTKTSQENAKAGTSPQAEQNQIPSSVAPTLTNSQFWSGVGDFFGKFFSSLRRFIPFLR
ncbi:MAG: fibronectin type III domain-containing protein [Candidatus Blackburnbacteria bacterium]|nr:fibronectin type III domain-containing protein [Candidatus Blackburnbacteria bacterium]